MKLGLGESYDRVDVLPKKLRGWLDITKPASTVGVMGAYLLGSLFYFYYIGNPALIGEGFSTIVFVVVTMGFAHGASQALNMAEDAEMDRETEHKQNRPIPSGVVTEEEARTVAWFLIIAAVGRAYLTSEIFGVMVSILVFFGVFYNLDPIRAKERIISIPWQAASRGLFSFPTIWAAYGDVTSPVPWVLGVFMFFYVLGFQNSADIIDRKVDDEHGIRTFVVEYGVSGTLKIATGSTLLMIATIMMGIELGLIPMRFIWMVAIIPFCLVMLHYMREKPHAVSDKTGNHPAWLWFYGGMMLCVAIPLIVEVTIK